MRWFRRHFVTLLLILVFLTGLGLLLYPSFSDYWNSFHQTRAIMNYAENVANLDTEKYKEIIESARRYNQEMSLTGIRWLMTDEERAVYESELNIDNTGNMGYIDIPKIDIRLPVYHGTNESVLQTSIGHLEGTSLPVGGEGSHCVLSGHRGLPSAKLFSDLDKMVVGDTFILTILNETLTYEVDQIRIVEPSDLSDLQIEEGQDYCTLLTCTPYGINTHRLLVRGHRIANMEGEVVIIADALQIESMYIAPFIAAPILLILLIFVITSTGKRKKAKKSREALLGKKKKKRKRRRR